VEHDEETMRHADFIIDLGPGAGVRGGEVVAAGSLKELLQHADSITGRCLRQPKQFPGRGQRRPVQGAAGVSPAEKRRDNHACRQDAGSTVWLTLHNAAANNLKGLTIHFPLKRLVVVSGVSGSGKSTLIRECLLPSLENALKR